MQTFLAVVCTISYKLKIISLSVLNWLLNAWVKLFLEYLHLILKVYYPLVFHLSLHELAIRTWSYVFILLINYSSIYYLIFLIRIYKIKMAPRRFELRTTRSPNFVRAHLRLREMYQSSAPARLCYGAVKVSGN